MEDYRQKYEEALERAKRWASQPTVWSSDDICQKIFPELKESKDERMLREIKRYIKEQGDKPTGLPNGTVAVADMLAWLERQDPKKHEEELENAYKCADEVQYRRGYEDAKREFKKQCGQKPTDKIKPKFKVGDIIRPKGSSAEYTIESIYGGCFHGKGWELSIDCDEDYELVEQNPVWSEEDNDNIIMIEDRLSDYLDYIREDSTLTKHQKNSLKEKVIGYVNWLKSLKERLKGE